MVITIDQLLFYKSQNIHGASEAHGTHRNLSQITLVGSFNETIFYIAFENGDSIQLKAESGSVKSQWISDIEKYRHKHIKIPIIIECPRDNKFNCNFVLIRPYNNKYQYFISNLLSDIMDKQHENYREFKFTTALILGTTLNENMF